MAVEQVTYKNIDRGTRNMIMAGLAIAMLASCFDSTIVGTIGFEIAKDLGGIFVLGLGLGCMMAVVMAAVQNSSRPSEMGMTTSAVNLLKSIGFTMGTAIFAMLINSRLDTELLEAVPEIYDLIPHTTDVLNGGVMSQFPMQIPGILTAFSNSVDFAFLAGGVIMLLLILVGIFFKGEMPPEEECETVGNDRK